MFFFCNRFGDIINILMDVETHTRNVWIILGTLSGLGMIVAFIRTWAWYSKSGKEVIDLSVRITLSSHIYTDSISFST